MDLINLIKSESYRDLVTQYLGHKCSLRCRITCKSIAHDLDNLKLVGLGNFPQNRYNVKTFRDVRKVEFLIIDASTFNNEVIQYYLSMLKKFKTAKYLIIDVWLGSETESESNIFYNILFTHVAGMKYLQHLFIGYCLNKESPTILSQSFFDIFPLENLTRFQLFCSKGVDFSRMKMPELDYLEISSCEGNLHLDFQNFIKLTDLVINFESYEQPINVSNCTKSNVTYYEGVSPLQPEVEYHQFLSKLKWFSRHCDAEPIHNDTKYDEIPNFNLYPNIEYFFGDFDADLEIFLEQFRTFAQNGGTFLPYTNQFYKVKLTGETWEVERCNSVRTSTEAHGLEDDGFKIDTINFFRYLYRLFSFPFVIKTTDWDWKEETENHINQIY